MSLGLIIALQSSMPKRFRMSFTDVIHVASLAHRHAIVSVLDQFNAQHKSTLATVGHLEARLEVAFRVRNEFRRASGHQHIIHIDQQQYAATIHDLDVEARIVGRNLKADRAYKLVKGLVSYT